MKPNREIWSNVSLKFFLVILCVATTVEKQAGMIKSRRMAISVRPYMGTTEFFCASHKKWNVLLRVQGNEEGPCCFNVTPIRHLQQKLQMDLWRCFSLLPASGSQHIAQLRLPSSVETGRLAPLSLCAWNQQQENHPFGFVPVHSSWPILSEIFQSFCFHACHTSDRKVSICIWAIFSKKNIFGGTRLASSFTRKGWNRAFSDGSETKLFTLWQGGTKKYLAQTMKLIPKLKG